MYQIALGDSLSGFTVIEGHGITPPAFKATLYFTFSSAPFVNEHIEIQLKASSSQIIAFLAALELIIHRANQYAIGAYPAPQQLRFQRAADEGYFYTPLSNLYLTANPAAYVQQSVGTKRVELHYTRPNHFDGAKIELPLSGPAGADITGGYPLQNYTYPPDSAASSVFINQTALSTVLPAPLRVEYTPTTNAAVAYRNFYFGLYCHPSTTPDTPFFYHYNAINGGTQHANVTAIGGNFRRYTWSGVAWQGLFDIALPPNTLSLLSGFTYRPILRLFSNHNHTDLYMRAEVNYLGTKLVTTDPVHAPSGYGYVILPPVELPPNVLLNEVAPPTLGFKIYALRESGTSTTIETDCITLFPASSFVSFLGYFFIGKDMILIDDSSRLRHNFRTTATAGESIAHARIGPPLLIPPQHNARLFAYVSGNLNVIYSGYIANLQVFYYPRHRLL